MKYNFCQAFIKTIIFLLLFFSCNAHAVVDPFVKADWGASPAEVMDACGMPAYNSIDFEAKRTNYLAYRQTISAYNFLTYYFFNDEQLHQVRLVLKDDLSPAGLKSLADTLSGRLGEALHGAQHLYRGTTPEGKPLVGNLFALSSIWRTPNTFSVVAVDTGAVTGKFVFDVLILDAANPANHAAINRYLGAAEIAEASSVVPDDGNPRNDSAVVQSPAEPPVQTSAQTAERAKPVVTAHEIEPVKPQKLTFNDVVQRLSQVTPHTIGGSERLLVYAYALILGISFVVFVLLLLARYAMRRRTEAEPGGKMQVKQALGRHTVASSARPLRMVSASRGTGKGSKISAKRAKPADEEHEDIWPPLRSDGSPRIESLVDQNFQILNILLLMLIIVGAYVFGALHPNPPRNGVGLLQILPYLGRAFAVVGVVNFICYLFAVKRGRRFWPYLATGVGFIIIGGVIIWIFKAGYI